jgi:hypothetical protein
MINSSYDKPFCKPPVEELPAYSLRFPHHQSRSPVTHNFTLSEGLHAPCLTLTVSSLAPSSEDVPICFADQPIKGAIELHLEKPKYFTSVEVEVSRTA